MKLIRPQFLLLIFCAAFLNGCDSDKSTGPGGTLSYPSTGSGPKRGATYTYFTELRSSDGQFQGADSTVVECVFDRIDFAGKTNVRRMVGDFQETSGYYWYDGFGGIWFYDAQFSLNSEKASNWMQLPLNGKPGVTLKLVDSTNQGQDFKITVTSEPRGSETVIVGGRAFNGQKIRFFYEYEITQNLEKQKGTFERTQTWVPEIGFYAKDVQPRFEDGPQNPGTMTSTLGSYHLP